MSVRFRVRGGAGYMAFNPAVGLLLRVAVLAPLRTSHSKCEGSRSESRGAECVYMYAYMFTRMCVYVCVCISTEM